jgi:hypothetical protein
MLADAGKFQRLPGLSQRFPAPAPSLSRIVDSRGRGKCQVMAFPADSD